MSAADNINPFAAALQEVLSDYQTRYPDIKSLDEIPHVEFDILQSLHNKRLNSPWLLLLNQIFDRDFFETMNTLLPVKFDIDDQMQEFNKLMKTCSSAQLLPTQREIALKSLLSRLNYILSEAKKVKEQDIGSHDRTLLLVDPQNDFATARNGALGCKKTDDEYLSDAQEEFENAVSDAKVTEVLMSLDTHGLESMWNSKKEMSRVLDIFSKVAAKGATEDFEVPISHSVYAKFLSAIGEYNNLNSGNPIGDISKHQLEGLAKMYNVKIAKGEYAGQRLFDKFPETNKLGQMADNKDELKKILGVDNDKEVEDIIQRAGYVWWGNHCTPGTSGWEPFLKWPNENGQPLVKLELDKDPLSPNFGEQKAIINQEFLNYLEENNKVFTLILKGSPESSHGDCLCHEHGLSISHAYGPIENAPHSKKEHTYNTAYIVDPVEIRKNGMPSLLELIKGNTTANDAITCRVVEVQGLASSHCVDHGLKELIKLGKKCIHNIKATRPVGGVGVAFLDFNDLATKFRQKSFGVHTVASNKELKNTAYRNI